MPLVLEGFDAPAFIVTISLFFAAVAQKRQTTLQRELDFAMKALTNGSTLTDCKLCWVELR